MQQHRSFWMRRLWLSMPSNVRKGLLRLYAVVSVPWIGWYGYQIVSHGPHWRYLSETFWTMLGVPVGSPVLLLVALWVRDGFRKEARMLDEKDTIPARSERPKSKWKIAQEERLNATPYEREIQKNPSTALLIISMLLFPRIWIIDVTSVSLYWIARLPKF